MSNTEALRKALAVIETDRRALLYSHAYPAGSLTIPADDEAGADALAQYDEAIHAIRTALAQQPAASGEPVAWHMRAIGCDGSADWCELGAERPAAEPGIEALPLVYAQPAASGEPAEHVAGHGPVDLPVGRPVEQRAGFLAQIEACRREVASWPEWMRQQRTAPAWMLGWDD